MPRPTYFPAFLNVQGRACLVVGNDAEALEKASRLAKAGAAVCVIASSFSDDFRRAGVTLVERKFSLDDVSGQFLVVFVDKGDSELARAIAERCRAEKVLLCAIDQPEFCDVVNASVYERGPLKIAISTDGISPSLAKKIRQGLEASLAGAPLEKFMDHLAALRDAVKSIADKAERRRRLIDAVAEVRFEASITLPKDKKS